MARPRKDASQGIVGKRLLTVPETAEYMGIAKKTLYDRTGPASKKPFPIKPKRIGGSVRFDRLELDRWIDMGCPE